MSENHATGILVHLRELRKRSIICLAAVAIGTAVSFLFANQIFQILVLPAKSINLIFIDVTEMIGTYMQVCLISGIVLAMPVLIYQLIAFVAPALTPSEKKHVLIILPFIIFMFIAGAAFGYFILIPPAIQFLMNFGVDIATPQIRISNYVTLIGRLILATGLVFETPVVTTFLARMGIISSRGMGRQRKWAILGSFILGALITPTVDPVNQTLIALLLIGLYEMSIWLAKLAELRNR